VLTHGGKINNKYLYLRGVNETYTLVLTNDLGYYQGLDTIIQGQLLLELDYLFMSKLFK
jgi:hypothetical protein